MKRVIIDSKNLTDEIIEAINEKYPYGYDDEDIIKFKNAKGETVSAIQVEIPDTVCLVKVGVELDKRVEQFNLDDDDDDDSSVDDATDAPEEDFED